MQKTGVDEKVSLQYLLDLLKEEQDFCLGQAAESQAQGREWRASAWSFAAQRILLVCRKLKAREAIDIVQE